MARGNWSPERAYVRPRCRLCRLVVTLADFVRLDGIAPAHRNCAIEKQRTFTEGRAIHPRNHLDTP